MVANPADWPYEWRPGWLPGETAPDEAPFFADLWVTGSAEDPGMIVALDPVTRLPVRPTPEQRRALSAALWGGANAPIRPDAVLPTERLPRGGELLHLPDGFQVFMVARKNADGRFTVDCVPDGSAPKPAETSPPPRPGTSPREER